LIARFDWDRAFLIMGILILVVLLAAAQFMKRDPSVRNQNPDGLSSNSSQRQVQRRKIEFSFKEALSTPQFWIIFTMILLFGYYSSSVSVHIVPQAENQGISPGTAANILATTGALLIVGRVLLGALADRIGNRSIYILGFTVSTIFLLWIFFLKAEWAYFVFAAAMGFCQGGNGVAQSPLIASLFGLRSLGTIFGLTGLGFTIGASIGPFVTGRIFDLSQSYQTPIAISIGVSFVALILALLLRPAVRSPARTNPTST
jgi:MFS family permease